MNPPRPYQYGKEQLTTEQRLTHLEDASKTHGEALQELQAAKVEGDKFVARLIGAGVTIMAVEPLVTYLVVKLFKL
jgi:hypothetical protein